MIRDLCRLSERTSKLKFSFVGRASSRVACRAPGVEQVINKFISALCHGKSKVKVDRKWIRLAWAGDAIAVSSTLFLRPELVSRSRDKTN